MTPLTPAEMEVLEFERVTFVHLGDKESLIRTRWNMGSTSYFHWLNKIIEKPAAAVYDPELVGRLQRVRDGRRRTRGSVRPGWVAS